MLILHPSKDSRLLVQPLLHIGQGQLAVVPELLRGPESVWAAQHPGEVVPRLLPGGSFHSHVDGSDLVRWRDHTVYHSLGGMAFRPQCMCRLVMYAIPTVPAFLVGGRAPTADSESGATQ